MMKMAVLVVLALVAATSAGLIGTSTYTSEGVHQIHSPWAVSSSSRVQTYNDAVVPVAVPVAAPIHAAPLHAPLAYAAAPVHAGYASPYLSPYAPLHSAYDAPLLL